MSSHRATHRRPVITGGSSSDSPSGRRRGASPSRFRPKAAWLVTGAAIGLATIGGLAAVQPDSSAASYSSSGDTVDQVSKVSPAADAARGAQQVSRAGTRPALSAPGLSAASGSDRAGEAAAKSEARERMDTLRLAVGRARTYGERLEAQQRAERRAERKAERLADTWVLPTTGFHISTTFGEAGPYWSSGYHTGLDFATAYGTPVVAVTSATVVQTGYDGAYGNQIRIQLENGDQVWYNHLSSIGVSKGQTVSTGEQLGQVGETGNAYGAHLHLEYRLASDLDTGVDPMPFLLEHGLKV